MRAIILAAGRGRRLGRWGDHLAKCMVQVLGRPMIRTSLDSLARAGIDETVLVVGHRARDIQAALGTRYNSMRLTYIENPHYATTNNLYSLWLARDYMDRSSLLLEADLVYPQDILHEVLESASPNAAVVDTFRSSMNGTVVLSESGYATKMVLGRDQGENFDYSRADKTVNIYKFSNEFLCEHFAPALDQWIQEERTGEYYEAVLAELIAGGQVSLGVVPMHGRMWAEIDDLDDLRLAESMLRAALLEAG